MMRIREEQMEAFSTKARATFENRMVLHLRRFFPQHCEALGEDGIRETIRHGIERARSYAIVAERDVCKYIDLMFGFDRDFDTDEGLPWARKILTDDAIGDSTVRTNALFRQAKTELKQARKSEED